ncbi:tetratricopeptide repeat protein [Candidatus Accumulibacter phosphatis]|uniref:tetratricopeptide repeat protein n=1 Tax=Candidatus Accumulibacter phosphatis TaxID=327160 RepID=UPI00110ABD54|nr:tetratricopeptide repeat protein [Candidatus Accumulibacter phosphatis]
MFRTFIASALMFAVTMVAAGPPSNITREEMSLIPRYCAYAQGSGNYMSSESRRWAALMPGNFSGIHHYCWAQIFWLRAQRANQSAQARAYLLDLVVENCTYVTKNAKSDFVLLPEIYARIGEAHLRRSRPSEANQAFSQARELKPDYWPAYSHWAEFLINSGKMAEAKQLVKSGLEYNPNSRILLEQYRLLGGKPSEIVQKNAKELQPNTDRTGPPIEREILEAPPPQLGTGLPH